MKMDDSITHQWPLPPLPNSYWVAPARLLAGEHPGATSQAETLKRLQMLLRAGINSFFDLTQDDELPPYEPLLQAAGGTDVNYRRVPILDHGLPDSPQTLNTLLDAVDAELASGRCVYVHCRAGIGRTGLAMGCYLVKSGMHGEAALRRLQILWRQCARSRSWTTIPETDAQMDFICSWQAPAQAAATSAVAPLDTAVRIEGVLMGLGIGDALGRLVLEGQFDRAGLWNQLYKLETLPTHADTAMTLAVAESLLTCGRHDPEDQLQRYLRWSQSVEAREHIPAEMKRVLAIWQWSRKTNAASHDPKNLDPHTLVRSLLAALDQPQDVGAAMNLAVEISRTTLQSPVVLDLCRCWTALLMDALRGRPKAALLTLHDTEALQQFRARKVRPELHALLAGSWSVDNDARSALSVSGAVLLAFKTTDSFQEGVLQAVTTSRVPTTAGALAGALAGAHYGLRGIPGAWCGLLARCDELRALARRFAS